jgi:hypothetical protein
MDDPVVSRTRREHSIVFAAEGPGRRWHRPSPLPWTSSDQRFSAVSFEQFEGVRPGDASGCREEDGNRGARTRFSGSRIAGSTVSANVLELDEPTDPSEVKRRGSIGDDDHAPDVSPRSSFAKVDRASCLNSAADTLYGSWTLCRSPSRENSDRRQPIAQLGDAIRLAPDAPYGRSADTSAEIICRYTRLIGARRSTANARSTW